jgi:hypothetical protein
MRKATTIAGLILAVGVLTPGGALGKAGGADRPIKDDSSGTTVIELATLGFVSDATGIGSHLGRTATHFDGAVTFTGPDTIAIAGSFVTVAANGDQLFGTFSGSGTDDHSGLVEGTSVYTFTGGTGRFEGASGSAPGSFRQVLTSTGGGTVTFAAHYSLNGTISY